MRFLVALASVILGGALAAGYIYRDQPNTQITGSIAEPVLTAPPVAVLQKTKPQPPKIVAPEVVAEIADAQPTVLNADRSRFESVATAPAPAPVTRGEKERARRVLVMALQGELRRVRCYDGTVNGKWNTASKAALFWFLKRMNAKLPVNKPDHAQLNLLKSAANDFCAEKPVQSEFVTQVTRENNIAEGVPDPTSPIQGSAFSDARQRAGLPSDGRVAFDGVAPAEEIALPAPMTVGAIEEKKKRRKYRARSRQVENLFKHPLGRF